MTSDSSRSPESNHYVSPLSPETPLPWSFERAARRTIRYQLLRDQRPAMPNSSRVRSMFGRWQEEKHTLVEDPGIHVTSVTSAARRPVAPTPDYYRDSEGLQVHVEDPHVYEPGTHPPSTAASQRAATPVRHIALAANDPPSLSPSPPPPPAKTEVVQEPVQQKPRWWRRKRFIFAIIAAILVIAIVAGVAGGVESRKASESQDGDQSAAGVGGGSGGNSPSVAPDGRIHSTRGAWNGTSLVVLSSATQVGVYYQCFILYQSYTGALQALPLNFSEYAVGNALANNTFSSTTANVSRSQPVVQPASSPFTLPAGAGNGTSLAGQTLQASNGRPESFVVVYANADGVLNDLWSTRADPSSWKAGNLGSRNFKIPLTTSTAQKPALLLRSDSCFGATYGNGNNVGSGGLRLWAGHADGTLHQYAYDLASETWASADVSVRGSSALGGLALASRSASDSCLARHVLASTDTAGKVSLITSDQTANAKTATAMWPNGPAWLYPPASVPSNASLAADASLAVGVPLTIPDPDTNSLSMLYGVNVTEAPLQRLAVDMNQPNAAAAGGSPAVAVTAQSSARAMVGSALGIAAFQTNDPTNASGVNLLVFQGNGTSIDWGIDGAGWIGGNVLW